MHGATRPVPEGLTFGPTVDNADARDRLRANVSRETFERLEILVALLTDWNRRLNLVSTSTIDSIWQRHVIDSAQLVTIHPTHFGRWVDIGTGGGFPGLVMAILGAELTPDMEYVLLEAHRRKAEFLSRVVRATDIHARIVSERAEAVGPMGANRVSARAVAPLVSLLPLVARHLDHNGIALLMKGEAADEEIHIARQTWSFTIRSHGSMTGTGAVLVLSEIAPVVTHA